MKKTFYFFMLILLLSACRTNSTDSSVPEASDTKAAEEVTAESEAPSVKTEENKGVYQKISAEDAKKMMDEQDVIVVDVRTESEYNSGHIPNAILLPNETIGTEPPAELPDKDAILLLYCRSGNRSRQAAEKLLQLGYQRVYDFGGIGDWSYEIVTE